MKIRGTTINTPIARSAVVKDAVVSDKPWSSKNTVDKLCPAFEESGLIVTCEPVEGYPLSVAADAEATAITRCGKNMLDYTATSQTKSGVTYTVNEDKSITVNGTATATDGVFFDIGKVKLLKGAAYHLSGCPSGGNGNSYYLYCGTKNPDYGSGLEFTAASTYEFTVKFYIAKGRTLNNAVIKPMVRQADTPSTYEPPKAVETFNPGEPIPALPGVNTIFADVGEVTVTGRTDPNAVIKDLSEKVNALSATMAALTGV